MVVVPLSQPANESETGQQAPEAQNINWVGYAASGTLIASGLLLLTGRRRAGVVAAASGAALAMLDQKDTLRSWWKMLPGYIDEFQRLLGKVQGSVEDFSHQRENLRRILEKTKSAVEPSEPA